MDQSDGPCCNSEHPDYPGLTCNFVAGHGGEKHYAMGYTWPVAAPAPINAGGPACGHPPFCPCPTPAIDAERLERLATQWEAEQATADNELIWCPTHRGHYLIAGDEECPGGGWDVLLDCGCWVAGCYTTAEAI